MAMVNDETGEVRTDEEIQEFIRQTIARHGRFFLCATIAPEIGEVKYFAGLPMRCVRLISKEEAMAMSCPDIWGVECDRDAEFYFEVEVAD